MFHSLTVHSTDGTEISSTCEQIWRCTVESNNQESLAFPYLWDGLEGDVVSTETGSVILHLMTLLHFFIVSADSLRKFQVFSTNHDPMSAHPDA